MALYKALQTAYIGDKIIEKDAEVSFDGIPGSHLEPLDAEAKKAVRKATEQGIIYADDLEPLNALPLTAAEGGAGSDRPIDLSGGVSSTNA